MKTVTLMEPHRADIPDETVIEKAMNLIASLGAPGKIRKLLSDLEEAANADRELVKTATALKSEIDRRECELSEHETDLCERESVVTATNLELTETAAALKNAAADLEHRENALTEHQTDFREKKEGAVSYIAGVLQNLDTLRKGLIDG